MTTSGDTTWVLTARDVVTSALEDELGILGMGETADSDQMAYGIRRLNALLKHWQMEGVTWKGETISQAILADTAATALPAYVRGVNGVRFVQSATNERNVTRWERDEYLSLPNKASSGTPTVYYVDEGPVQTIYVWPVPTVNSTLKIDIDRATDTVTDANETVDIPEELQATLIANLAVYCAGRFQSGEDRTELFTRAARLERQMFDTYRPSYYLLGRD